MKKKKQLENMTIFMMLAMFSIVNFVLPTESYRILGIFPFASHSHNIMFNSLIKGLARKGHQIAVITVFPMEKTLPNYNFVLDLSKYSENLINKWNVTFASEVHDDPLPLLADSYENDLYKYLELPEMQRIIKNPPNDSRYDLVLVESFGANCYIGFGYIMKVPVAMISSTIELPWLSKALGQPENTAYFPAFFSSYKHPMSFLQRVHNTVIHHMCLYSYRRITQDIQNSLMKKYLSPDIPALLELEKNVPLALVNSFYSLNGVRPLNPGVVEIAGIHVQESYIELPQGLERWMNESTASVVYFTFGSMINIETLPENTMRAIYAAFEQIASVRVLMKVGKKENLLSGLPDNVMTSLWISQVAILAHKNTKIFITHGGLLSIQEALTFGVPTIGIPLFGDQLINIEICTKKKIALELNIQNFTTESIYGAISEILNNSEYKTFAKYESICFLDRPMNAMDTAIYWIEYVIRNGPGGLISPATDMNWWQVTLLDVYVFLALSPIIFSYLIWMILKFLMKELHFNNSEKQLKND